MNRSAVTQEWLHAHFSYDHETGVLRQIKKYGGGFGPRKLGEPIGVVERRGYLRAGFLGRNEFVHRVIWLYVYGEWPKNQIDHIDGLKHNNRIENLREATNGQNKANTDVRKDSATGIKGVTRERRLPGSTKVWRAHIAANGRRYYTAYFETAEEARTARNELAVRLHGQFYRES